ncbi:MAG TPA: Gfo/Idh/MocA family oxidoreductase [Streptosporangiaceae bacterium]|nr:Gfo/Idh/MocA family oxidoreductase [Streptosporangiaceae bacterium]
MNSEGLRVGVVGIGYWGSRHVRVLRSTTGVAAVIGVDSRFRQIGNGFPHIDQGITAYADIADALPHVDAVVIATPPASHALLGQKAIAAGKHVLIEKPLATTSEAARALVDAAEDADVVLMPGHTFEHNAAVHKLRDLLRGGDLGRPFYLDCARLNLGLYQTDVNVILDLAPHDISISNFVLGSRPTTVTAWGSRYVHPQHEDVAYLRLDYADLGVRTNIHVSWLDPHKVRRITAVGSKKMVVYNDMAEGDRIRVYDKSAVPPGDGEGPLSQFAYHLGDTVSPFVAFAEPLAVQDQHFVDCITNGLPPSVEGTSGLAVVQVLECAQISLREQRPVALAEVTQRPNHHLAQVAEAR